MPGRRWRATGLPASRRVHGQTLGDTSVFHWPVLAFRFPPVPHLCSLHLLRRVRLPAEKREARSECLCHASHCLEQRSPAHALPSLRCQASNLNKVAQLDDYTTYSCWERGVEKASRRQRSGSSCLPSIRTPPIEVSRARASKDRSPLPTIMPNHFDPSPSEPALRNLYVGKSLGQVNAPAAILDRAIVKRNCGQMLDACRSLRVGFRAHVKTHKVQGTHCSIVFYGASHLL